jgi:hypothetical protein
MFMSIFELLDMGMVSARTIYNKMDNYLSNSSNAIYKEMTSGHAPLDYNGLFKDARLSFKDDLAQIGYAGKRLGYAGKNMLEIGKRDTRDLVQRMAESFKPKEPIYGLK